MGPLIDMVVWFSVYAGPRSVPSSWPGRWTQGRDDQANPATDEHVHSDAVAREGTHFRGDGHAGQRGSGSARD